VLSGKGFFTDLRSHTNTHLTNMTADIVTNKGTLTVSFYEQDAAQLTQLFPHSQLITIADAGHWVHANQPDAFYEAVLNFAR
jgi:pimeloyl-ACP methyl ester carboxylesterase